MYPKRIKRIRTTKARFSKKVVDNLIKRTSGFNGTDRFVTLILGEMKIKRNLIFVKHTGNLIVFTDLGDTDINTSNFKKKEDLATHALLFFARDVIQI